MLIPRSRTWLTAAFLLAGCMNTHDTIVSTAAIASDPWTCRKDETQVTDVSSGRYRLEGCGETAIYNCNYAFTPPRCWK